MFVGGGILSRRCDLKKKTKVFMWLVILMYKIPTQDYLKSKQKVGPNFCYLSRHAGEDVTHLFMH